MTLPRQLPWLGLALFFCSGVVGCGELEDKRPAEWSFIYATIVQPQCATVNCHSAIAKKRELDLSERDLAYCKFPALALPDFLKQDTGGTRRMPPDAPLPSPDIELLTNWAAAGAINDKFPADLGGLASSSEYCQVHVFGSALTQ
jgi:hypothetical protein